MVCLFLLRPIAALSKGLLGTPRADIHAVDSRYPNYMGEITLWTGLTTVAAGVLVRAPVLISLRLPGNIIGRIVALALCSTSPAFTTWALTCVTGIPISERKYDRLYGDRKDYRAWKDNTPTLIPKIF